jgi:hypothetical protein
MSDSLESMWKEAALVLLQHLSLETKKNEETFVRMVAVLTKVLNDHLPETGQKRYWANQLAWCYYNF